MHTLKDLAQLSVTKAYHFILRFFLLSWASLRAKRPREEISSHPTLEEQWKKQLRFRHNYCTIPLYSLNQMHPWTVAAIPDRGNTATYQMSNTCECMGVNGEPLQLHAVHKKSYFFTTSHKNLYQVLQVTCTASEHAMKLTVNISLTPSSTRNNIPQLLRLALLLMLDSRNNTDGNKLVIFLV